MRALLIEKLYDWSKIPYQKWLKKSMPWPVDQDALLDFPKDSLGFHLGRFLQSHNFDIQPKLEDHDVFHVLTATGVTVPEEIGMQFYLFGNGKRSLYQFSVMCIGSLLYPDKWAYFIRQWRRGKNALCFHQLDFLKLLDLPVSQLRTTFLIQ